jgi:putative oxidoreductase
MKRWIPEGAVTARADADRLALFMLRLLFGGLFIYHGFLKVVMGLHGPGLEGFAQSLQSIGFYPGLFWAWVVTIVEFVGGIFVFVGFATRLAALAITIEMIVAGLKVNLARGFLWTRGGLEVPLIFAVLGIIIVLTGPGSPSVDHAAGWERGGILR